MMSKVIAYRWNIETWLWRYHKVSQKSPTQKRQMSWFWTYRHLWLWFELYMSADDCIGWNGYILQFFESGGICQNYEEVR